MNSPSRPSRFYVPKRYTLVLLAHFGFAIVYALRVNLSVALVAMVNSTYANAQSSATVDPECKTNPSESSGFDKDGEFNWDQNTQGLVLGSFFYGYVFTQIPGGMLAKKFGGKWVFGIGVLCTCVLTLLTPIAARTSVKLLVGLRILEGFGEAVSYPAMNAVLAPWAPPLERTRLSIIAFSGATVGTVVSLPVSGLLCNYGFAGGWPSVFYVFGSIGIVWFCFWAVFMHSYPEHHPGISTEELNYIKSTLGNSVISHKVGLRYPWKAIFTSGAFWGILITHFCNNWVFYTLLTSLPTYFKEVLNFPISTNGFLSAVPYLFLFIVQMITGVAADYCRSSGLLSTKATRKMFTGAGLTIPAVLLAAVSYIGCDRITWAVVFMTLAVGTQGLTGGGFSINHLDIAPNYAALLLGLTNSVATIPGCVAPSIVGYFTENKPTREQWQKILFISSGISLFGAFFYAIMGQGAEQPWNKEYDVLIDDDITDSSRGISPVNTEISSVVS